MPTRQPFTYNEPASPGSLHENVPCNAVRAEFAKRLSEAMARKGYSQSEVARRGTDVMRQKGHHASARIGRKQLLSRDNVANWVRGLALPGPIYLGILSEVLDVKRDWLLPARGVPSVGKKLPKLDLRSTDPGMTFLTVAMNVPTDLAVEIYQKIKQYEREQE